MHQEHIVIGIAPEKLPWHNVAPLLLVSSPTFGLAGPSGSALDEFLVCFFFLSIAAPNGSYLFALFFFFILSVTEYQ